MELLSERETEEVTRLIIAAPLGKDVCEICKPTLSPSLGTTSSRPMYQSVLSHREGKLICLPSVASLIQREIERSWHEVQSGAWFLCSHPHQIEKHLRLTNVGGSLQTAKESLTYFSYTTLYRPVCASPLPTPSSVTA